MWRHQSKMVGASSARMGCFYVPGEQGIPAGGAGEYPALLLGGADYNEMEKKR